MMPFNSSQFWAQRYNSGGNSGAGSYGHLSTYKAHFLNEFVKLNGIQRVTELGCGDGHQLSLALYPEYIGFDVANGAIELCTSRFSNDTSKQFFHMNILEEYGTSRFACDLALSLDVLFHLVEDDVYENYMNLLFSVSRKYVIVYSSAEEFYSCAHVKSRNFLQDVDYSRWYLSNSVDNAFPYSETDQSATSFCRFYVFVNRGCADGCIVPQIHQKSIHNLGEDDQYCFDRISKALIPDKLRFADSAALVANYSRKNSVVRILDLGCGAGNSYEQLLATGLMESDIQWTGCDIEDSDEVRSRTRTDLHFVTYDGVNLPFDAESFDIVLCDQVLEHVKDVPAVLREVRRVLARGGCCIGSTSHVELFHSRSYGSITTYGLHVFAQEQGFSVQRFSLGIDSLALIHRRLDGRPGAYAPLFDGKQSRLYTSIARAGLELDEHPVVTFYRQLLAAGQYTFVLAKDENLSARFDLENLYFNPFQKVNNLMNIDRDAFNSCFPMLVSHLEPLVQKRTPPVIVSLTTFPERIPRLHITLYSLFNQVVRPDRIVLWLASDEFPDGEAGLPSEILLFKNLGLEICFCQNFFSYKKIIPSLAAWPEACIVTADDDIYYPDNCLQRLYVSYRKNPKVVHAVRLKRLTFSEEGNLLPYNQWEADFSQQEASVSYFNFLVGCGGVLYPPQSLHEDVLDVERFTTLAPYADDVWLWAMAVRNSTKICRVENASNCVISTYFERDCGIEEGKALFACNGKDGNDVQLVNVFSAYPELLKILESELRS